MKKGDLGWVWRAGVPGNPVLGLLLTDQDDVYGVADVLVDGVLKSGVPVWASQSELNKNEPAATAAAQARYIRNAIPAALGLPSKFLWGEDK